MSSPAPLTGPAAAPNPDAASESDAILGESFADLRATRTSVKWRTYPEDVLPAWVAEMDSRPCPPVVEAVNRAMGRGDTGYAWTVEYAAAYAQFAADTWGWNWAPESSVCVADVMTGVAELLHANVPAHAGVVISPPCYDAFFGFVDSVRRRRIHAPLNAEYRLDFEALDRAFAEAGPGGAYLLCNPQNPTGTLHTGEELATLARLADSRGILVISDEIHAPLVQPGAHFTPYLTVPEAARGIAVLSGSKAFNLAALRAALVIPGAEATGHTSALHEVVTHGAQYLGVIAQTAAFTEGRDWLDRLLVELADRRALLHDELAARLPSVHAVPSRSTFLAWLDCSALGLADPTAAFLEHGRVALAPGLRYDPAGGQHARFNIATSRDNIIEAVRRMSAAQEGVGVAGVLGGGGAGGRGTVGI